VQLNFVRPQSLEISNDPPKSVDVTLTGSRSKLDSLSALDLVATIDITDQRAGERMVRLADKVEISLPQGVKVEGFLPSAIPIRLEPIIEKELTTEPKVEGQPANGQEVYSVIPSQASVTVRGPASRINALDKAPTETIFVTGQTESFLASNVAIDIPDPKVDLLDPAVNVQILIGEKRIEKSFADVPVTSPVGIETEPNTATVTIAGPREIIDELRKEEIKVVLNSALEPSLELPSRFEGKLILKSINPSKFTQPK
jgi:YbbR domain-containing protein